MVINDSYETNSVCITTLLLLTLCLFALTGCVKKEKAYTVEVRNGVEIVRNRNIESAPDLKLDLKLITKISLDKLALPEGVPALNSFNKAVADYDGNIYISNQENATVFKFDPSGNYLKFFHRQGQGPGESRFIDDILIIESKVYVVGENGKVSVHKTNGDFVIQNRLFGARYMINKLTYSDGRIFCRTAERSYDFERNKTNYTSVLYLLDNDNIENYTEIMRFEAAEDLTNYRYLMGNDHRQTVFGASNVYVEDLSFTNYAVDVYDISEKKIRRIEKQTRRIECSDDFKSEVQKIDELVPQVKFIADYMKQILGLHTDKNGNLWVKPAIEGMGVDHQHFDIFNNQGIFLKRIELPIPDSFKMLFFDKNKLIVTDRENLIVKVFEYEFF